MLNNLVIYAFLASIIFGGYKYMEFQSKEIETLKSNAETQKLYFDEKIKTIEFNAKVKEKKKNIEKGIKRDESTSVSITSTRFYLN